MSWNLFHRAMRLAPFFVLAVMCPAAFAIEENSVRELSTKEVQQVAHNNGWVFVDTRITDAFNGWALDGVERGGHLPGAVDFAANWLRVEHPEKEQRLLEALRTKGIERSKHVLLYDATGKEHAIVAAYLRQLGFRQLYHYDVRDWAKRDDLPLVRYENYQRLVPAPIVKLLLARQRPETFGDARLIKFAEVSWGDEDKSYAKGHVPGSFHVNTDDFEPPPTWMLGSPEVLTRFAKKYGFTSHDTVIISGEDPTACYRLAIVLRYMGVKDARVLHGGLAAWKSAGYAIETKSNPPPQTQQAEGFGVPIPQRPQLIDSRAQVKAGLLNPHEFMLVDNRTWAEHTGETSGYTYHRHKGRIPGSVYGQAEFTGADSMEPYRNLDKTMRNADEIRDIWKRAGIDPEKHLSFMCGSGWRAAEVLSFADVMGVKNAALYSDGWIGWSNDPANPVEPGPAQ